VIETEFFYVPSFKFNMAQASPRAIQMSVVLLIAFSLILVCTTLYEKPCRNGSYAPYKTTSDYGKANGNGDLGNPYVYRDKETLSAWPYSAPTAYVGTGPPAPSSPEPLGEQTHELTGYVKRAQAETYTPQIDSIVSIGLGRMSYMDKANDPFFTVRAA
jgi:hypothetical protein